MINGNPKKTINTDSPEATLEVAVSVAGMLKAGDLIALIGELGSGKTMFVKGLARGLGVPGNEYVNSPSFVLLKEYRARLDLYHFDVYRLDMKGFCETIDYEKYFYGSGVTVVEWADKIKDILTDEYLEVVIKYSGECRRQIELRAVGDRYADLIRRINKN